MLAGKILRVIQLQNFFFRYSGLFVQDATVLKIDTVQTFTKALKRARKRRKNTHSALKVAPRSSHFMLQLRVLNGLKEGHLTFVDLVSSTGNDSLPSVPSSSLTTKLVLSRFGRQQFFQQREKSCQHQHFGIVQCPEG